MNDIFYPVAHREQEEIDAIKNRYQIFDDGVIPVLIKQAIGLTATTWVKPTTWGTSHVTYIVSVKERQRPLVLRANIGFGAREVYMQFEKRITDNVAALGVPVNRILYVDTTRKKYPFDYQIQDALDGSDIEDHFHGTREDYDQLSFDLGRYVGMWGSLKYEGFGRFDNLKLTMYDYIITCLDADIAYLCNASIITKKSADAIRKLFDTHKAIMPVSSGTLVHYDLADHNIMFDGGRMITGIFDWEAAVIGDPILDLASCSTWKTHHPREKKLIEGYRAVRDLPTFFQEKMDIYRLRTMIWKMVYAIRAGILNDERKKKFEAALVPFRL